LTVEKAQQLTNRFFTRFNHAVPFDVDVIETIWNHCRGPRCAEARRAVNEKLRSQVGGILVFPEE
jgi:hypothetical protein